MSGAGRMGAHDSPPWVDVQSGMTVDVGLLAGGEVDAHDPGVVGVAVGPIHTPPVPSGVTTSG